MCIILATFCHSLCLSSHKTQEMGPASIHRTLRLWWVSHLLSAGGQGAPDRMENYVYVYVYVLSVSWVPERGWLDRAGYRGYVECLLGKVFSKLLTFVRLDSDTFHPIFEPLVLSSDTVSKKYLQTALSISWIVCSLHLGVLLNVNS